MGGDRVNRGVHHLFRGDRRAFRDLQHLYNLIQGAHPRVDVPASILATIDWEIPAFLATSA